MDDPSTPAADGKPGQRPSVRSNLDLFACVVVTLASAGAVAWLPPGNLLRVIAVAPVLLFVPGYVLLQALLARAPVAGRGPARHPLLSLGISPPLVAILALSTAVFDGGFRATPIVAVVTIACLMLALTALVRRAATPAPRADMNPHGPASRGVVLPAAPELGPKAPRRVGSESPSGFLGR